MLPLTIFDYMSQSLLQFKYLAISFRSSFFMQGLQSMTFLGRKKQEKCQETKLLGTRGELAIGVRLNQQLHFSVYH